MTKQCKAHPYAEAIGGVCPYCRLTRMLRASKRRTLPATWGRLHHMNDAVAVRVADERARMLGIPEG